MPRAVERRRLAGGKHDSRFSTRACFFRDSEHLPDPDGFRLVAKAQRECFAADLEGPRKFCNTDHKRLHSLSGKIRVKADQASLVGPAWWMTRGERVARVALALDCRPALPHAVGSLLMFG